MLAGSPLPLPRLSCPPRPTGQAPALDLRVARDQLRGLQHAAARLSAQLHQPRHTHLQPCQAMPGAHTHAHASFCWPHRTAHRASSAASAGIACAVGIDRGRARGPMGLIREAKAVRTCWQSWHLLSVPAPSRRAKGGGASAGAGGVAGAGGLAWKSRSSFNASPPMLTPSLGTAHVSSLRSCSVMPLYCCTRHGTGSRRSVK